MGNSILQADSFHQLLDAFKSLSSSSKDPTFMEIAGYPHYENVCSNILAFYLRPDAAHGLSDLCLKALLSLASVYEPLSNVTVEREVTTNAGNRIDLLIQSDTHLIAIENKIYHSVANPLHDYVSFLEQQRSSRTLITFLLSLYPVGNQELHGFIPIRYADLFAKLRPLIGDYIARANTKFLISLTDFIDTIENLMRGSAMDESLITLFHERGREITALLDEVNRFKAEMRSKVTELRDIIDIQGKPVPIEQDFYREKKFLFDCLMYDISLNSNFMLVVLCCLSAEGWKIVAFDKNRDSKKELALEEIQSLFETLKIPSQVVSNDRGQQELIHLTKYPYNEPLSTIQGIAQDWINRIAYSQNP